MTDLPVGIGCYGMGGVPCLQDALWLSSFSVWNWHCCPTRKVPEGLATFHALDFPAPAHGYTWLLSTWLFHGTCCYSWHGLFLTIICRFCSSCFLPRCHVIEWSECILRNVSSGIFFFSLFKPHPVHSHILDGMCHIIWDGPLVIMVYKAGAGVTQLTAYRKLFFYIGLYSNITIYAWWIYKPVTLLYIIIEYVFYI